MAERFNVDEQGRPVQDVYGAFPEPGRSREGQQAPAMPAAGASGEVHDGGASPAAVEAHQPTQEAARPTDQPQFDGGRAPSE